MASKKTAKPRASTVDALVRRLEAIAHQIDVPYPHWLGGQNADQGPSYCLECAQKHVAAGDAEFVDGGWQQDNDGCCHCEDCGALLDYTLTECGVEDELSYFRSARLRRKLAPETAYHLSRLLEHHREHPEVLVIVPKVQALMARAKARAKARVA